MWITTFKRQTDRYVNMISKQKTETQHLVSIQATHVESICPQQILSKICSNIDTYFEEARV